MPSDVTQPTTGNGADLAGSTGGCVDGGSCTTANPGDCAIGHAVCSGAAQSCVPDVTTQRCYTGPAATANVGACKSGTQTCIGSLGSCAGEVGPAAVENCFNDVDDDCDGVVNNGCPDHLVTGTPRALGPHGNSAGGSPFSLRCPANSYVTKIVVYGDNVDLFDAGIDIVCATPTLVRGASSYTVTATAVTATPSLIHGVNADAGLTSPYDCGVTGFNPGFYAPGASEPGGLDELGLSCGVGTLTLGADNKLAINIAKSASLGVYGYINGTGETNFEDDCAAGEVLIGFDGRYGNWFDETHAVCAPLQVVYK